MNTVLSFLKGYLKKNKNNHDSKPKICFKKNYILSTNSVPILSHSGSEGLHHLNTASKNTLKGKNGGRFTLLLMYVFKRDPPRRSS